MQNIVYHIVYTTQKIASLKTGFIDGLNYIITGKSTSVQKKKNLVSCLKEVALIYCSGIDSDIGGGQGIILSRPWDYQ